MVTSLALIDDDHDHAESHFFADDEATTETVLAFSLDESASKSDYSSESDYLDHCPYEIRNFFFLK